MDILERFGACEWNFKQYLYPWWAKKGCMAEYDFNSTTCSFVNAYPKSVLNNGESTEYGIRHYVSKSMGVPPKQNACINMPTLIAVCSHLQIFWLNDIKYDDEMTTSIQ